MAGAETAAIYSEEPQNICIRKRRQKITENGLNRRQEKPFMNNLLGTDRWISSDPLDNEIIEVLYKKDIREGEEKLMLAVLSDAIEQFQKHVLSKDERGKKLFRKVEEWFLEKDGDYVFSFENICETLELHPDYIRQGLMSWKEARRREHSLQTGRGGRKKSVKTQVAYTSLRFSRTA